MRQAFTKLIVGFSLLVGTMASATAVVSADFPIFGGACTGRGTNSSVCQDKDTAQTQTNNSVYGPNGILQKATDIILFIIGIAASIVIVVSGIRYILANGDSGKISQAKDTIIYALVGIGIALLARTLITFVLSRL